MLTDTLRRVSLKVTLLLACYSLSALVVVGVSDDCGYKVYGMSGNGEGVLKRTREVSARHLCSRSDGHFPLNSSAFNVRLMEAT